MGAREVFRRSGDGKHERETHGVKKLGWEYDDRDSCPRRVP